MVRTCDVPYPVNSEYEKIFTEYPFSLSDFQKYAIEAIEKDKHILVTAHTGSGKTLPAEYAIQKFHKLGKKVVYTSPIKSLSNQKFSEFSKKFPDINFGILTGDIKYNPEGDCLIMTTEILRNTLFQKQMLETETLADTQLTLHFEMDIQNELACVIFDEIHYINDRDRGKVWEETIMMLPDHVLLVMLSATMDRSIKFAGWIEDIKKREVYWAPTNKRVVPLTHFGFVTLHSSIKKKLLSQDFKLLDNLDKLLTLRHHHENFQDKEYYTISNLNEYIRKKNIYVNQKYILNSIVTYLNERELLPAICFVFSRRKTEEYAKNITTSLNDGKTMTIIRNECKQMLINKLPNYAEFTNLPEYNSMVKLLMKGIAVHHSGILPILREMVEMLFSKGYIKLLFATETFAVGVNMPTKSVIFTSLKKYDGSCFRYLLPHEYTQMAGRAGRRGLDDKGYVIHLNNMFDYPSFQEYRTLLCGKPQRLESKFSINFNLILRLISTQQHNIGQFADKSMLKDTLNTECKHIEENVLSLQKDISEAQKKLEGCKTPRDILYQYTSLHYQLELASRKKRKQIMREKRTLHSQYETLENDFEKVKCVKKLESDMTQLRKELKYTQNYVKNTSDTIFKILVDYGFITRKSSTIYDLTEKGELAANIQEINCLVFGEILHHKMLNELSPQEIACVFSCFANVSIPEDKRKQSIDKVDTTPGIKKIMNTISEYYQEIHDIETQNYISSNCGYNLHYELCDLIFEWCDADTPKKCKIIFHKAKQRNISLGELTKAVLKINNIACELEQVCNIQSNIALLDKIKKIPELTLKSVTTNQSLYL